MMKLLISFKCPYTHTHTQGHKETLGGDGYIYYLVFVVMILWIYAYVQIHQIVYINTCSFLYLNYILI